MVEAGNEDVTRLLRQWSAGDRAALSSLMPLVYDELRRLARRSLLAEHPGHTLQTTALVHEAYIKLVRQDKTDWKNRAQFFGVAAQLIRRILIDYGRAARTDRRRAMIGTVALADVDPGVHSQPVDFLSLHEALEELERFDEQKARVVELRFFGGLSVEEVAEALKISTATVKREWSVARAWLAKRVNG